MGRNFQSVGDRVDVGTPSGVTFDADDSWTFMAHFRVESLADDRTIVAKWDNTTAQRRQFHLRVDHDTSNQEIEVRMDNVNKITGSSSINTDIWYFVAVLNNGGTNTLWLYSYTMDGTAIDNGTTGTSADPTGQNNVEPVLLGSRDTSQDQMVGDIANAIYIAALIDPDEEVKAFMWRPQMTAAYLQRDYDVKFYLPLGFGSPEADWSGTGNTGTVTGATIGENPPVGTWFGGNNELYEGGAAAPATVVQDPLMAPGIVPTAR